MSQIHATTQKLLPIAVPLPDGKMRVKSQSWDDPVGDFAGQASPCSWQENWSRNAGRAPSVQRSIYRYVSRSKVQNASLMNKSIAR